MAYGQGLINRRSGLRLRQRELTQTSVQAMERYAGRIGVRAPKSRHICNSHRSMAHAKLSHNRWIAKRVHLTNHLV